jgi:uncharacterized protein (DUF2147 family)
MARIFKGAAFLLGCTLFTTMGPVRASTADPIEGVWRNRPGTLVVRIAPCGSALCGTVINATEDAQESVRKAGTAQLIGTKVLTNLHRTAGRVYSGEVFNPNLNIHAAGTITLVSPSVLLVKGCVLVGLICRQQHWSRIGQST